MTSFVSPGQFGRQVAADARRVEFDIKNQTLLNRHIRPDYLFFGDSITHFWELSACFSPQKRLVNRGISGDDSFYASRRFEADVLQLSPECCVFLLGINDAWALEDEPWAAKAGKPVDAVIRSVCDNLNPVWQAASRRGQTMAVCSLLPFERPYNPYECRIHEYIRLLNAYYQAICREYGFIFVDYFHAFSGQKDFSADGLHPNAHGYELMADALRQALRPYGLEI